MEALHAGVFEPKRVVTADGFERTFQVNVLSPYLLTGLLLPRLASTSAAAAGGSRGGGGVGGRRRGRRRRPNNSPHLVRSLDHHAQGPNIPVGNPSLRF